jgi:nucleoside-diphosphate-sugar epimerase
LKLFVTGVSGFLGSHLIRNLIDQGHHITGIVRPSSDLFRIKDILHRIELSTWSKEEFSNRNFDAIIHTATDYGRNNELSKVLNTNLIWPIQIFEVLATTNPRITFINTDTFFNNEENTYHYLEEYTLSKRMLEMVIKTFDQTHSIINMKLEHIYGPWDSEKKFISSIIKKILSDIDVDLTDGFQRRDFIYVNDVVNAYSKVLNSFDSLGKGFHNIEVGNGESHSIRQVLEMIKFLIPESNSKLNWGVIEQRKGEFPVSKANLEPLNKLGWNPRYTLCEGLTETINFYKNGG